MKMKIETPLDKMREDYDWMEVWGIGHNMGRGHLADPENAVPGSDVSRAPFGIDDVAELLGSSTGYNDGDSWVCVVRLRDGRYAKVDGGCDYTGWD